MITRLFSRLSVLFLVLLISACSTFSFIFERLDWFTLWRLDKMFDLTEEQEDQIQPDLIAIQEWMRNEGFPETISRLERLLEIWQADESESAYLYLSSSIDSLNKLYLNAMKEAVVKFSMRLTEENAQQYRHYSNKQQKEWFESTHSIEARIEHEIERFEDWFGHLSDQQVKLIENRASLAKNELQIRIANHISWREAYIDAALKRDTTLISAWLDDLSIFWTPEYTQLKQHNDKQRQTLVFELFPTLTSKQKRHARKKVEDWLEKLHDISHTLTDEKIGRNHAP